MSDLFILSVLPLLLGIGSWCLFAIAAGVAAYHRGRDVAGYLILGVFTGCFALIFVLIAQPNREALERRAIGKGEMKICEACLELAHTHAQRCSHCAHIFDMIAD